MIAKQRARACALQALYQWQVAAADAEEVERQFLARENHQNQNRKKPKIHQAFFSELIREIPKNAALLDALIVPCLERKIDELGAVEHAALYIGVYELKFNSGASYKIIINEAVELTKRYGASGAYKLVNRVLDQLARKLRAAEIQNPPA